MGIHHPGGQVGQLAQGHNGGVAGDAGGQAPEGDVVEIEAVAIKG